MSVTTFKDLPLAPRDREWDAAQADKRVRAWAHAEEEPNQRYRQAYLWYDNQGKEKFGSYKLPIADVIGGKLEAVPRAIMSAAGVIEGARGGVDLPEKDVPRVKSHLEKYFVKMGESPPWEDAD